MRGAGSSTLVALFVTVNVALAQAQGVSPSPVSAAIDVRSALYGRNGTTSSCSALVAVRKACQGRMECAVPVSASVCTDGQAPSVLIPALAVTYRCNVSDLKPRSVVATKPFTLRLSCMHLQ